MNLQRETQEPTKQRDAGNVPSGTLLQKRTLSVFILVLVALVLTARVYYRSWYLRSFDRTGFWVAEVLIGAWFVYGMVRIIREGP